MTSCVFFLLEVENEGITTDEELSLPEVIGILSRYFESSGDYTNKKEGQQRPESRTSTETIDISTKT